MSAQVQSHRVSHRKRKSHHPLNNEPRNSIASRLEKAIDLGSNSYSGKQYAPLNVFQNAVPSSGPKLAYPGDEGQDGSALPDVVSAEVDSEADEHAQKERDDLLKQARKARLEQEKRVVPVPDEVAMVSQGICHVFRKAWKEGRYASGEAEIAEANARIQRLNEQNNRPRDQYIVPAEHILLHIELLRGYMIQWTQHKYENKSGKKQHQKAAKSVAALLVNMLPVLADCGISYKATVDEDITSILQQILDDAELSPLFARKLQRYIQQDLFLPMTYQACVADKSKGALTRFFDMAENGELESAKNLVPQIDEINSQLTKRNEEFGIKGHDHLLPTDYLSHILEEDDVKHKETRSKAVNHLKASFASILSKVGYKELGHALASNEEMLQVDLPEVIQTDLERRAKEFERPMESQSEEFQPVHSLQKEQNTIESLQAHTNAAAGNHTAKGGGAVSDEPSSRENWGSSTPELLDIDEDVTSGIPGPYVTDSGQTQWGQVVQVQRVGLGYRLIFNKGSTKYPIFEMRPGSCLPKGVAKSLAQQFEFVKHKQRRFDEIELITDIAELVSGNITRFRVLWKTSPTISFPTRTELSNMIGKEMMDGPGGVREKLQAKRDILLRWHKQCGQHGWHPDFRNERRSISITEKANLPWIFGSQQRTRDGDLGEATDEDVSESSDSAMSLS